jgi:Fic family protein
MYAELFTFIRSGGSTISVTSPAELLNFIPMSSGIAENAWGSFIPGIAKPDPSAYGGRAVRRGGRYNAFVPPDIASYSFTLGQGTIRDVQVGAGALRQLQKLDLAPGLHSLAETLLRSESVASSRIEGVDMTHARLARARYGDGREDKNAREVIANIDAMRKAIDLGASSDVLGVDAICDIHRALIRDETLRGKPYAGVIREEQNWIGGNDYNPVGAIFVPPPQDHVRRLLDDLEQFIARDDLDPLAQAAIAHAQFETIHPFLDGNGRVGRALVYAILRRRGLLGTYVPPISLVLDAAPRGYTSSLAAYQRRRSAPQHPADLIVQTFSQAAEIASSEAAILRDDVEALRGRWRDQLKGVRADAAAWKLVDELPGRPVLTAPSVGKLLGISAPAAGRALQQLQDREILKPLNAKKWGRAWEASELLTLVEAFERRVAGSRRARN